MALIKWYEVEIDNYANLHKEPSKKVKVILEDSLRYILDVWGVPESEDWELIIDISDYAVISLPAESWQAPKSVKAWLANK